MDNFNMGGDYDSIPKLNKKQKKIFKTVVFGLILILIIIIFFEWLFNFDSYLSLYRFEA